MDVILHQGIRVHIDVLLLAHVAERGEEELIVVVTSKHLRSVVATLNDMLGQSGHLQAMRSSHVATYARRVAGSDSQRYGWCSADRAAATAQTWQKQKTDDVAELATFSNLSRVVSGGLTPVTVVTGVRP